jgi:hypothetical protein
MGSKKKSANKKKMDKKKGGKYTKKSKGEPKATVTITASPDVSPETKEALVEVVEKATVIMDTRVESGKINGHIPTTKELDKEPPVIVDKLVTEPAPFDINAWLQDSVPPKDGK